MHSTQTVSRRSPLAIALFFLATLLPLYYGSWRYHITHPRGAVFLPASHTSAWSDEFVGDWLGAHVVEPFDPAPLAAYCNASTWRPNLVFNLDDANGGIGNVRGNVLDFVFYAIEAGASIMLPGRASRSQTEISNVWGGRAAFDSFFDEDWFLHAIDAACPQMVVYRPQAEHSMVAPLPGRYQPWSRRMDEEKANSRKAYLEHLDTWLNETGQYKQDEPNVANLERTLWNFDTRSLPDGVRRNIGQLLRINPTVRRLAASVVQKLATTYSIDFDPAESVPRRAFYGAHLRTEADAVSAGWLNAPNANFSAQTDAYMQHALKYNFRVMYVASGNETDLALFAEKAAQHVPPLNVTSKLALLAPAEADELAALTWDQQALVDYEVLQRCSVFGGFVRSSFSYNIAMTRNQWLRDRGRAMDPWFVIHSESGVAFDDGVSRVIGRDELHEARIPRGMWP